MDCFDVGDSNEPLWMQLKAKQFKRGESNEGANALWPADPEYWPALKGRDKTVNTKKIINFLTNMLIFGKVDIKGQIQDFFHFARRGPIETGDICSSGYLFTVCGDLQDNSDSVLWTTRLLGYCAVGLLSCCSRNFEECRFCPVKCRSSSQLRLSSDSPPFPPKCT